MDRDIISYITGKASLEITQKVDIWLMQSDENQITYNKIEKILEAVDGLRDFRILDPDIAWQNCNSLLIP